MQKNRWYDKNPVLGNYIESLKLLEKNVMEKILIGIKDIIKKNDASLIDRTVLSFTIKRRWYDQDPYAWLIINALQFADKKIITTVIRCLKKELGAVKSS